MLISILIMTALSAVWLYIAGGVHGTWGIKTKRLLTLKVDKRVDRELLRVISRYNAGELILQESKYGKNLLFTKMAKISDSIEYAEANFYVNIEHPDKFTFGRITNVPISSWSMRDGSDGSKGAISNKTFDLLNNIIKESFSEDNEDKPKKKWFRKFKKEEVHLS